MKRRLSIALIGVLFALTALALGSAVLAQSGVTNFNSVVLSGDLIAADDITAGDDLSVGGFVVGGAQSEITVAMTGYITPTGTYQPLTAAGTVGTSFVAAGAAGSLLVLINTANQTIVISDTGILKLSGNASLGQYDTLTLWSDGTNWIEIAQVDN